jgi:CspA family cold shock protein
MVRMNGTIRRLVRDTGVRVIGADRGAEYFFHRSASTGAAFDQLREGQSVSFDVGEGPKGPRAENVKSES